ncbi:hypothetical protein HETIRDRAFT_165718 [Heterobasidion irregulare TC 32-1]|uniref:Uncharacterized protein n=1 Tax=Heterobasidion irregulare (strain TC 32-1) TaxID=747525 RepID=W4KCH4_HETIT|nr:uncharacterized protein HETIRDRAFT_165718 [Heterobasidion irregulare TC 32-1]ETW83434.1 hypothetical protein HETIRDRAFT_165718 [Heterobasidion irregulare TC 32-1]
MTMMMMVADSPYSPSVPVNSCYAVQCGTCGKTTWKGCGQHVESVRTQIIVAHVWAGGCPFM